MQSTAHKRKEVLSVWAAMSIATSNKTEVRRAVKSEQESDDWGVGWMQSCRQTCDDEPIGDANVHIAEQTPCCGSVAGSDGYDRTPGEPAA